MITAQREIGQGLQEIVSVDPNTGVLGVLAKPITEPGKKDKDPDIVWTFQAPKTLPDETLMAYRAKQGDQFNINSDRIECVIFTGPDQYRVLPRPVTKTNFWEQINSVQWLQHGHASPTDRGTLLHAALEYEASWFFGFPVRKQWCVVETDLFGKPTGYKVGDRAEPSWSVRGLTTIDPSGTGRIVTPTRVFDKATSPIGSKSFGWFDPHLSPDGSQVVWLDLVSIGIGVTSGLILGDLYSGKVKYLIKPTLAMQTDGMWLDYNTIIGSKMIDNHWQLVRINATTGVSETIPNTLDCTAVHIR